MSDDLPPRYAPFVRSPKPLPAEAEHALRRWTCREGPEPLSHVVAGTAPDEAETIRPRRARRPRRCTVGSGSYPSLDRYRGDDEIPTLRLRGLWLEALGFTIGSQVRITAEAGVVTLSVEGVSEASGV